MIMLPVYLAAMDSDEDRDKFTYIYEHYFPMMRRVAMRYTRGCGAEDDIVHDAFLKIIDHMDQVDLDAERSARCFICTIVKNKALDWWRKETKLEISDLAEEEYHLVDESAVPGERILSSEGYEQVVRYIRELGDTYRDVCNLKFICGLKEREIAEVLGISPKNVSVRIVRGRQKLIARIEEERHDQ